jgi:hypothetical protein
LTIFFFVDFYKINFSRADILSDGSVVITIKPVLSHDPHYAKYLTKQKMNLWGTILIKEEEKLEEIKEELTTNADDKNNRRGSALQVEQRTSDVSFGAIYEEKDGGIV